MYVILGGESRGLGVSEASYYIGKINNGSKMGHNKKIFKKMYVILISLPKPQRPPAFPTIVHLW